MLVSSGMEYDIRPEFMEDFLHPRGIGDICRDDLKTCVQEFFPKLILNIKQRRFCLINKNDLIEIIRSSDWSPDFMAASVDSREMVSPPKSGRDKISQMVLEDASKITPQYGIELMDVMFKRVNYIESVRLKVYDRMISERKRIAAEKR